MEEELRKLFVELVKFSKEASPEIWAILIKQQLIYGYTALVSFIFGATLFFIGAVKTTDWDKCTLWTIFFCLGTIIGTMAFLILLLNGIGQIFNPGYEALMALKP